MKKLNNKGITLVELIVSFALVSVSVIYFYQTVYTVRSLYSESQRDTNNYVRANYALRLADELFDNGCVPYEKYTNSDGTDTTAMKVFKKAIVGGNYTSHLDTDNPGFCYITFDITDSADSEKTKEYTLYKEPIVIKDTSSYGYDAALLGGAKILSDEDNKYISFDGKNDFVQLPSLPGCSSEPTNKNCIKWSEGFIVEFKAKWDDPTQGNSYRRIIDFSAEDATANTSSYSGNQNIYISSQLTANQLVFGGRKWSESKEKGDFFSNATYITLSNSNALTNINAFRAVFTPIKDTNGNITNYKREIYLSGVLIHESISSEFWSDVTRTVNYIGYAPWVLTDFNGKVISQDVPFKGRIYYVKIDAYVGNDSTMKTILNIDANNYKENN